MTTYYLEACPFCESDTKISIHEWYRMGTSFKETEVSCSKCKTSKRAENVKDAVTLWNRRRRKFTFIEEVEFESSLP